MQLDVFDTYVTQPDGQTMHFDVLIPKGGTLQSAKVFAMQWLRSIGVYTDIIQLHRCRFCHSESASPEIEQTVRTQGFAILQMEGCPSPIF